MFKFSDKILSASEQAMKRCKIEFDKIESITEHNQQKMLRAFIDCNVSESHFMGSTGYGYDDRGREILDKVYAKAFGAQDALVRFNFLSGTHALTVALFGVLRPGDSMLSVTGLPYDTMLGVIGVNGESSGSLKEFGIKFESVELLQDGTFDYAKIKEKMANFYKVVHIQRSSGYNVRGALSVYEIEKLAKFIKENSPKSVILVDNCYGEFAEKHEPTEFGADLIVGSLIKNPGGGIAPCGGYIAGNKNLMDQCSFRLSAPGIGREVGATLGHNRELFMGAFNSPHVVGEALKSAVFASALFEILGYEVSPHYNEPRHDIIQRITFGYEKDLVNFCQGLQSASPVDSAVVPEPWDMPGYDNKIIMAAGAFTLGSSIELSADAPIREPYAVWLQGGLNFHSAKIGILTAAEAVENSR